MIYHSKNREYKGLSRYQVLRLIEDGKELFLETYNPAKVKITDLDSYHVVEEKEVNRLDIISNKYYGTPTYWWMIALANNLIDPLVVNKGTMLRIPALVTINSPSSRILFR